jgi:hypothetical protein
VVWFADNQWGYFNIHNPKYSGISSTFSVEFSIILELMFCELKLGKYYVRHITTQLNVFRLIDTLIKMNFFRF